MTARTVAVVSAGLSQPSSTRLLADRLAAAAGRAAAAHGVQLRIEVVELRDHAHDLTNDLLSGFASEELEQAKGTVAAADGVIAVSPVFSGSYNGLFKTFFDVLEADTLRGVPVLLGATAGTARHSLALEHALRPLFAYLGALVVPTAVFAASEDWGTAGGLQERGLAGRIDRAAGELSELIAGRERKTVTDPFADPTPFGELLGGRGER